MKKMLPMLLLLTAALTIQAQAVQIFMRPSVAINKSQPGLPDVPNEDVQNQLYTQNVFVLPNVLDDSHFNLEIWATDDVGNPIEITSISSLTRTISSNKPGSVPFTWNGALYAPDNMAAPVAQTYTATGAPAVNNTAGAGLWYSQVVGTDLTNKAVREVVISGAAIDASTLGGMYMDDQAGFTHSMTWTATVNGVVANPVTSTVTVVVPEPSSIGLLGLLGSVVFLRRKR